jgi:hypothetical protein
VITSTCFIVLRMYYCIVLLLLHSVASSFLSVLGYLYLLCSCVITSIRFIVLCTYYFIVYVLMYCVVIIV